MKVIIAGFNLDQALIGTNEKEKQSPESVAAAYARISRSKKAVDELRKDSIKEVEKARKSNESIIFDMGHNSVAEHAVFNIDIIGVSRLLAEYIQKSRFASFTEKSQRYVRLNGDYVVPQELQLAKKDESFCCLIERMNRVYCSLYEKAQKHLEIQFPKESKKIQEGRAKEDARYILPLATETQMGMTINARSLEHLLRRLDGLKLQEAKDLHYQIESQIKGIAPSLVRYTHNDKMGEQLTITDEDKKTVSQKEVKCSAKLVSCTANADREVLTNMLYEETEEDFTHIQQEVSTYSIKRMKELYQQVFTNIKPYQSVPRAFESVHFSFELQISASCFAQLKRHRILTVLRKPYNIEDGYVVPPLFHEMGCGNEFSELYDAIKETYKEITAINPLLGNYLLPNAQIVKAVIHGNLREFYHFSRLRSDQHAQWEIQVIAHEIDSYLRQEAPLSTQWLMGKSEMEKEN